VTGSRASIGHPLLDLLVCEAGVSSELCNVGRVRVGVMSVVTEPILQRADGLWFQRAVLSCALLVLVVVTPYFLLLPALLCTTSKRRVPIQCLRRGDARSSRKNRRGG
jgi:hypothetical protein